MLTGLRGRARRARVEGGFTVIELTVAFALLGVIVVPAFVYLSSTQHSERVVSEAVRQQQDSRVALNAFARAIRESDYPDGYTYSSSSIFVAASSNDVTFYSDLNNDGVPDMVRYWLDGTNINRTETRPDCSSHPCDYFGAGAVTSTTVMVENARNPNPAQCGKPPLTPPVPLFSYYKADKGTGSLTQISPISANDLVDINYVVLAVLIDITTTKSPVCQTLTTSVSPRNWRG
jgi:type II secretory pathway component PulJ